MLNEILKSCEMTSPDVRANLKQQKAKELPWNWCLYHKGFSKKYLKNLKYIVKRIWNVDLILVGIPTSLMLSVKKSGVRDFT